MPLDTDYPAAEVVRTGRAVYLPTPEEYRRRYPAAWPLAQRFQRQSWAFLPLIVAGPHHRRLDGGVRLPGVVHARRALRPDDGRPHAGAGAVPRRDRRVGTGADARAPALHDADAAARHPGDERRRPLCADRRRPAGRRRLVRHDPAALRPHRARHRRRPGARRAGRRPDGTAADRAARLRLRGAPPGRGALPRLPLPVRDHRPITYGSTGGPGKGVEKGSEAGDPRFATCLYIEVDPATGILDIARAGHPDPRDHA